MDSCRILKMGGYYDKIINLVYEENPTLASRSYSEQYNEFVKRRFGWSDVWKHFLEKTGRFEVTEIIVNAEPAQKQWAKENDFAYSEENWFLQIAEEQIIRHQPEILFINELGSIPPTFRAYIKKKVPSIKLIMGWDGVGQNNPAQFADCDLIAAPLESSAKFYKEHGFVSYFFPLGFDSRILHDVKKNAPKYDVTFVGSVFVAKNLHKGRLRFLSELSRKIPLDLWTSLDPYTFYKDQIKRILRGNWQEFKEMARIKKHNRGSAFGLSMYQTLADSKLTLNYHIDAAKNEAANLRLYEATGVGACLITDWKENITNFFEPGYEIVTFKTVEECAKKIEYLLSHEAERVAIAKAGQERTLRDYSYDRHFEAFGEFLWQEFSRK